MWQRRPFSYTVRTVDPAKSSETSSCQQVLVVTEQFPIERQDLHAG